MAVEPDDRMRAVLAAATRVSRSSPVKRRRSPPRHPLSTSSSPSRPGTGSTSHAPSPRSPGCCARPADSSLVWTGPDRSVDWMRSLWAGGIIFSPEEKTDEDGRRRRRHLVSVDAGGDSPFLQPETKLFRWTRAMTKADLVALSATYSAVITMDEAARRAHLEAMTPLPRHARGLRRARRHRRPDALLLLAGHQGLSHGESRHCGPSDVTVAPPGRRRRAPCASSSLLRCASSRVRRLTPRTSLRHPAVALRSEAHRL